MKVLIDTQIILHSIFDDSKLSQNELEVLQATDNEIVCCSISLFEISLKYSIGKLKLNGIFPDKIPTVILKSGFSIENIDYETLSSFYKLPRDIHKDPFDRMIIWYAIEKGYFLMSQDDTFEKYTKYGLKLI